MIMRCYFCNTPLNSKTRDEHIIPSAIGGRLKSKNLICNGCNESFGNTIDFELAKQLNPMVILFNVQRDRRGVPPALKLKTSDGTELYMKSGGSPTRKKPKITETDKYLHIIASSKKEVIQIAKRKLQKKKIKNSEHLLNTMVHSKGPELGTAYFTFDFTNLQSIAKIVTNFTVHKTGTAAHLSELIAFIKGETPRESPVTPYYPGIEFVGDRKENELLHTIHIVGDSIQELAYAYVELFNAYKFLVKIDGLYRGPSFNHTYCLDVLISKEVNKSVSVELSRHEFVESFSKHQPSIETIRKELLKMTKILETHTGQRVTYLDIL